MTAPDPLIPPKPVPPTFPLRRFLRRNLLLTLTTLIFVGITVLVLVQIDRVYYDQAKVDLMRQSLEDREYIRGDLLNRALTAASLWVEPRDRIPGRPSHMGEAQREALVKVRLAVEEFVEHNPIVLETAILDTERNTVVKVERPERMATQNDFSNCLLIRNWSALYVPGRTLEQTTAYRHRAAYIRYTTPQDDLRIEELTKKWRLIAVAVVIAVFLIYALLLWTVILPTRSVMSALDKGARVGSPFLERPRSLLEKYYNNLARDATLSVFSTHLRSCAAQESGLEIDPVIQLSPRLVSELFPVPVSGVVVFRRTEKDVPWVFDQARSDTSRLPGEVLKVVINGAISGSDRLFSREVWNSPLMKGVFVVPRKGKMVANREWWDEVLGSIADEIGFALRIAAEQRRVIFQEKSKANISLSRNLGHDLTNIIATSKLELMTLKSLLEMKSEEIYKSERKQKLFRESLESVLSSTRFLQETVNLYRSFTYLSRPKFEEIQLNSLVEEAGKLFKLSVSRNIAIAMDLDDSLPSITVEPRLLKLAVFNLLNNAADAIKLGATAENPRGEIILRTSPGSRPGHQVVTILDSGMGIRGPGGELLGGGEIERIFSLGYTTKEQGTGEGLGLNWVSQIVRDFHGGELIAANRPEGGASFSVVLSAHVIKDLAEAARDRDSGVVQKHGEKS